MDGLKSDDGVPPFAVVWRVWKNMRSEMNKESAKLVCHCERNLKIRHPPKLARRSRLPRLSLTRFRACVMMMP